MKYLMIWMMLYVASLCLVKSSICFTTLRIATTMTKLRIAVYVLLSLTVATFITTFTGILLLCRPVKANWDQSIIMEGRGECSPMSSVPRAVVHIDGEHHRDRSCMCSSASHHSLADTYEAIDKDHGLCYSLVWFFVGYHIATSRSTS